MEKAIRVLHHKDCTYCIFRKVYKDRKGHELEFCKITNMSIPGPHDREPRYCEDYKQEDCPCEKCNK